MSTPTSTDEVLMNQIMPSRRRKPPSTTKPPSKRRQIVLDEDEYLNGMEAIIQRDFFPDLLKLRALEKYLKASKEFHVEHMNAAVDELLTVDPSLSETSVRSVGPFASRLLERLKRRKTLNQFEPQPKTSLDHQGASSDQEASSSSARQHPTSPPPAPTSPPSSHPASPPPSHSSTASLSLDSYCQRYTSEDNDSFHHIQEKEHESFKHRNWWMYDPDRANRVDPLTLKLQDQVLKRDGRPHRNVETWTRRPTNALMWAPDYKQSTEISQVDHDKAARARLEDQSRKLLTGSSANFQKNLKPKHIVYQASRVPLGDHSELFPLSVSGPHAMFRSDVSVGSLEKPPPMQFRGYEFVAPEPPASPGRTSQDTGPSTTWGTIRSTPQVISRDEANATPGFRIKKLSRRQQAARDLGSEAGRKQRRRAAAHTPSPSARDAGLRSRTPMLSPAAFDLAKKLGKVEGGARMFRSGAKSPFVLKTSFKSYPGQPSSKRKRS